MMTLATVYQRSETVKIVRRPKPVRGKAKEKRADEEAGKERRNETAMPV